jgi:capsular polysaccharide transport system permease protein
MSTSPSIRRSLMIQWRVICALLMREVITRFGRRNLGVLWLLAEPMLFTLVVMTFWAYAGMKHISAVSVVAFAITGYSSALLWRNTVSHCMSALQSNISLLYHRNVLPLDVFIARILLELAGATASFALLTVIFSALELIVPPADWLSVVGGWLMLAWFGSSLGLLVGSAAVYSELVARLWTPMSYILFPLSGAAFMVSWLPADAQRTVLLLPMVHCVELIRQGYFGDAVRTYHDMGYVAIFNLVLMFSGLVLLRGASRQLEAQ